MTATDLEPVTSTVPAVSVPSHWEASWRLAQRIAATPFVPGALRGRPEAVLACVLYGSELNLGPMQSLASIHVIDGRPAAAPELMRALIARAGHRLDVEHATDDTVTLVGTRADTGATARVTWTLEDARRANLLGKGAWKTYPRAMLLARATSELARMIFADVIAGLSYTPEEVSSIDSAGWGDDQLPPDPLPEDPSLALVERLRGVAGTEIAVELREVAAQHGRRLTASDFHDYPEWRTHVHLLLDRLLADQDVIDAEIVRDDTAAAPPTAAPTAAPSAAELIARIAAAAGTDVGEQLESLAARSGRQLTIEDLEAHPVWAQVVAEVLDTDARAGS
jgi:hypothetical protein